MSVDYGDGTFCSNVAQRMFLKKLKLRQPRFERTPTEPPAAQPLAPARHGRVCRLTCIKTFK